MYSTLGHVERRSDKAYSKPLVVFHDNINEQLGFAILLT